MKVLYPSFNLEWIILKTKNPSKKMGKLFYRKCNLFT